MALVMHVAAEPSTSTTIERFEKGDVAYSASVDSGTSLDELGLPGELRAVVSLNDPEAAAASFEQAEPGGGILPDGYAAPADADELRESGETVIYTVSSDEAGTPGLRIFGSIDGGDAGWYSCDDNGNPTGLVLDVPVSWEGDYDPDEPGVYTLTSSFGDYTYAGTRPYAVITVAAQDEADEVVEPTIDVADEEIGDSSQDEASDDEAGIATLAATSGTIYVNQDGTGEGTSRTSPAALNQSLLDGLTGPATLTLVGDIELSERLTVPAGADVTIVDDGTSREITFAHDLTGNRITVESGATLTLETSANNDDLLTVRGEAASLTSATRVFLVDGTLNLSGGTIRDFTFGAYASSCILIRSGNFDMSGGTITANSFTNQWTGVLVVNGDADATISGGAITGNTIHTTQSATVLVLAGAFSSTGSAASQPYVQGDPTLTMTGGSISDNVATNSASSSSASNSSGVLVGNTQIGGNAYSSEATFTMEGGAISGNGTSGVGGGVYVCGAGNFYMKGGEISGNSAFIGGGVAVYDIYVEAMRQMGFSDVEAAMAAGYTLAYWRDTCHMPGRFEMTGGTITGNEASYPASYVQDGGCGGGVYIASDTCVISAGTISNNTAGSQGGGVYVGSVPYTLRMYNTLITGNKAEVLGGGLWFCPTGDATLTVTNGSAVYGNIADSDDDGDASDDTDAAGDDFVAVPQTNKTHVVNLADRMLGGGEVAWYKDGGVTNSTGGNTSLGVADGSDRYDPDNPGERLTGNQNVTSGVAYKAVVTDNAAALAESLTTVHVTGNTALRGGGIGANGAVVIGIEDDEWTLDVTKDWGDIAVEYRQPVTIRLVIGDYELDAVELNEDNDWTASFTQLPNPVTLGDLEITVIEEGSSYQASYTEVTTDEGNKRLSITVTNELLAGQGIVDGMPWRDANGDGIQQAGELDDAFDGMAVTLWIWDEEADEGEGAYVQVLGSSEDGATTVDAPLAVTIQHGAADDSATYIVLIDGVYYTVTATATADGGYEFSGLPAGTYRVGFTADHIAMGSFTGAAKNEGVDPSVDSDADYVYVDEDGNEYDAGQEYGQWLARAYIENIVLSPGEEGSEDGTLASRDNDAGFVPRTGSITVTKTDEDGTGLNDVTFKLELLVSGDDENDPDAQWQTIAEGDNTANTTATVEGEDGKLIYDNLQPGIYRLTETGTTSGNSLLIEPVYITIPYDDGGNADEVWDSDPSYMHDGTRYMLDLGYSIENRSVFALPNTGGSSWPWHLIVGTAIIAVAAGTGFTASSWRRRCRVQRLRREIARS